MQRNMFSGKSVYIFTTVFLLLVLKVLAEELCSSCKCKHTLEVLKVTCVKDDIPQVGSSLLSFPHKSNELWFSYHDSNITHAVFRRYISMLDKRNLTNLSLDGNHIQILTRFMFNTLYKLNSLSLNDNNIQTIEVETFSGLGNLSYLSLSKNSLESLKFDAFSIPSLKTLNLSFNSINDMVLPLKPLLSLAILDLSHNKLSRLSTFNFAPKLKILNLSHNSISDVSNDAFFSLHSLEIIDLSNNKVVHMEYFSHPSVSNITSIYMQNNFISKVVLPQSKKLSLLILNHNNLSSIDKLASRSSLEILHLSNNSIDNCSIINTLENLKELDVSQNKIKKLPTDLPGSLQQLNISHNIIEMLISNEKLSNSGSLNTLDMSFNPTLTKIPANAFLGILNKTGVKLYLSHCSISNIHEEAFKGTSMSKVDLSSNKLKTIPRELFNWEVVEIDLQNNPLQCTCPEQWLLDTLVPLLYARQQKLLDELRCHEPEIIRGKRLAHWYNRSDGTSFCHMKSPLEEQMLETTITMKSSTEMLLVFSILGVAALTLVIVGFMLQRKRIMRRLRANRRF